MRAVEAEARARDGCAFGGEGGEIRGNTAVGQSAPLAEREGIAARARPHAGGAVGDEVAANAGELPAAQGVTQRRAIERRRVGVIAQRRWGGSCEGRKERGARGTVLCKWRCRVSGRGPPSHTQQREHLLAQRMRGRLQHARNEGHNAAVKHGGQVGNAALNEHARAVRRAR